MSDTKYDLTPKQIDALNAARDVFATFNDYAESAADGMLYVLAQSAADGIFKFLNFSQTYGGLTVTDEQMFNRKVVAS